MTLYDLLPTKKVTAFLLGGAITIAGFWILIERGALDDWPDAWVMASFAIIAGFIVAWFVPESTWRKVQGHLEGTVVGDGADAEVRGDVSLTPTGEGTADIEGEVAVSEEGEILLEDWDGDR